MPQRMRSFFADALAILIVLFIVAIVVSPFVDLPLTTVRPFEALLVLALALALTIAASVVSARLPAAGMRFECASRALVGPQPYLALHCALRC